MDRLRARGNKESNAESDGKRHNRIRQRSNLVKGTAWNDGTSRANNGSKLKSLEKKKNV